MRSVLRRLSDASTTFLMCSGRLFSPIGVRPTAAGYLRHCAFSHGAVLLKPFWTGPPHVVQLRSIVIEYFSEEGVFHLQNLGPEPHGILAR